jgi:hypothetical protein
MNTSVAAALRVMPTTAIRRPRSRLPLMSRRPTPPSTAPGTAVMTCAACQTRTGARPTSMKTAPGKASTRGMAHETAPRMRLATARQLVPAWADDSPGGCM